MKKQRHFREGDHVRIKKNVISTWHGAGRIAHDQVTDHDVLRIIRDDGDGTLFQACHALPHEINLINSKS